MATTTPPRTTPGGHVLEPHPTGMFAALGRFDYRFRRVLPVIGLALVIGLNAWAAVGGGELIQGGWVIPGSQEQQAAHQLAKRFGQEHALRGVDLQVPEGAVYVLVGPNGAGKTTTMKLLLGLYAADSGTAQVLGMDPARQGPQVRAQVGYVPERGD